jgi:hypothetical protein
LVGWLLVPLAWAVAALPWAWWAAWWAGRRRAGVRSIVAVGIAFGWFMGSGLHPETAAIVCGSALIASFCFHPRRWWRPVVMAAVAGLTALVLGWATVGYILASSRAAIVDHGQANRQGLPWSVQRDLGRQILTPASMGHPGRGDWRAAYPHAPGAAGVGGAVLALAASGRIRRRYRRVAVAAGISSALGLVLLLRIPPLDGLLVRIPPLDQMTLPRFGVLIPWGVTVIAALALDGAVRGHIRPFAVRLVPAGVVAIIAFSAAVWSLASVDAVLVMMSVLMAVAVGFSPTWRLAPVLVVIELASLAIGINPVAVAADRLPRPPLIERLVSLESADPCRIAGVGKILSPNLGSRYGLRDLRASDPLRPAPFARLMGVLGEPATILGGPLKRLPAGLCGAWGVGLAVTPPRSELPGWRREYADRDGIIWSNPRLVPEVRVVGRVIAEPEAKLSLLELAETIDFEGTALVGPGAEMVHADDVSLELWRRTPTLIEASAECDGPCLVLVAQPWAPGWRAVVEGVPTPLVRTNIAGLGAVVPVGRHSIVFEYRPWAWWDGVP